MKKCKKCLQDKSESEFNNSYYKDKVYLLNECKQCLSERTRANYYADHDRQKEIRKKNTNKRRNENRQKIIAFLLDHSCVDCGEKDPIVLEFDHVNNNKRFQISDSLMKKWEEIESEINECEVVCANCHKRRTSKRAGDWHKANIES